jgi:hypothetical protein
VLVLSQQLAGHVGLARGQFTGHDGGVRRDLPERWQQPRRNPAVVGGRGSNRDSARVTPAASTK